MSALSSLESIYNQALKVLPSMLDIICRHEDSQHVDVELGEVRFNHSNKKDLALAIEAAREVREQATSR